MTGSASESPDRPARFPMILRILAGIIAGVVYGMAAGPKAAPLAPIGMAVLEMIKGLAGPLLFFAIIDAFLKTRVRASNAGLMVGISAINATIAIGIGLTLSNVFRPGESFLPGAEARPAAAQAEFRAMAGQVKGDRTIDFVKDLMGFVPTSMLRPLVDNTMISIVILAVLLGAAFRRVKSEQEGRGEDGYRIIEAGVSATYRALEVILGWVLTLIPLAIFAVVARTIGLHGFAPFRRLLGYVGVGTLGLAIQVFVVYQLWLILAARVSPVRFWAGTRDAIATAIGTGSSLATLPVTLRSLQAMGVSKRSARLAACVGTNLNNDGILLYEAMAVLFVAQAVGIELSVGQQGLVAASCVVAGIGISGVPDAGLISLLIVLKTVKLPDDAVNLILPFLLSVDWFLGRCRAATNVASDCLVAVLLDRLDGAGGGSPDLIHDPDGI